MPKRDIFEITLRLNEIDEFFSTPALSPLSVDYQVHSNIAGIEFIGNELYANSSYRAVRTKLQLPSHKIDDDLLQKVEKGVQRYCNARLRDIEQEIGATRWRGARVLIAAIIALFVFIGTSKVLAHSNQFILQLLGEGLAIAGWVAIWFPLEMVTYTFWQHRLERKIYKLLMEMNVRIEAS